MTPTTYKTATQLLAESLGQELLFGHTDEASALVIQDYPYGFRLRTSIRYWIETSAKHGDRFVSQTLNPKTGRWNKPKKSTYTLVGFMYRERDTGHIKWNGIGYYTDDEGLAAFCGTIGAEALSADQRKQLAFLIGRSKVMKHVTFAIDTEHSSRTPEEKAAHDAEQKAIEQKITKAVAISAHRAHKALTGEGS